MFKKLLIVSLMCGFGLSGLGAKDISTAIKSIEVNDKLLNFIADRCVAREEINEKDISNLKISSELKAELNDAPLYSINEFMSLLAPMSIKDRKIYCNKTDLLKQVIQEYKFIKQQRRKINN